MHCAKVNRNVYLNIYPLKTIRTSTHSKEQIKTSIYFDCLLRGVKILAHKADGNTV